MVVRRQEDCNTLWALEIDRALLWPPDEDGDGDDAVLDLLPEDPMASSTPTKIQFNRSEREGVWPISLCFFFFFGKIRKKENN